MTVPKENEDVYFPPRSHCIFCNGSNDLLPVSYHSAWVSEVAWMPSYNTVQTNRSLVDIRNFRALVCRPCWKERMHKSVVTLYAAFVSLAIVLPLVFVKLPGVIKPAAEIEPPIMAFGIGLVAWGIAFGVIAGLFLLAIWMTKLCPPLRKLLFSVIPTVRQGWGEVSIENFVIARHATLAGPEREEIHKDKLGNRIRGYRRYYPGEFKG